MWHNSMVIAWVAGRVVQATLDTGCSQTLLRAGLIPDHVVEWCKPIRLWCIHGGANQYERGYIDIKVANRKGCMKVGSAPELDREIIICRDWPPCMTC